MSRKTKNRTQTTLAWLNEKSRTGVRRIEKLGWRRLSKIYFQEPTNSPVRKAIQREARRCGYTPTVILRLNHY